jgi:anti-sigma B factor antagonist
VERVVSMSSTGHITTTDFDENGAVVRVTVHKLDEYEATRFINEFKAYLTNSGKNRIVMDYSEVEFVSSAGLGAMITTSNVVGEFEGKMVLTGINENVMQVMKLTKLNRLLKIEKDLAKAQKQVLKK